MYIIFLVVIAVSTSLKHNIRCIVFADVEDDNSNFTKIICHQLLEGFCYLTKTKGLASTDFDSYIGSMIRSATRPILYRLRTIRPITHFALVEGNNLICSTLDVDRVGLIATLVALIDRSTETSTLEIFTYPFFIHHTIKPIISFTIY